MKSMTLNDFLNYKRCKDYGEVEALAYKINKNKYLKGLVTFVLANMFYIKKAYAGVDKINKAGGILLNVVRTFGYWICIIMCVLEIIRSLMQGDTKSISKIIIKYAIGFGSFYFLPWIFEIIKDVFV